MNRYSHKAFLFDMDGVIIDSNTEIENFWKYWLQKEAVDYTGHNINNYVHGCKTEDTIDLLFKNASLQTKTNILKSAITFDLEMKPALIPGVELFLKNLKAVTKKLALVTSAPKQRAQKMLALHRLEDLFIVLVTGDMVQQGKPHPEPYLKAAYLLNILPENCLVFEDSDNGIQSAIGAGMSVIAVHNESSKHLRIIDRIDDFSKLNH